jgi:hypothetical protein
MVAEHVPNARDEVYGNWKKLRGQNESYLEYFGGQNGPVGVGRRRKFTRLFLRKAIRP